MRDKSGRSGRRRGSQKPGTACGAASEGLAPGAGVACGAGVFGGLWACAGLPGAAASMASATQATGSDRTMNGKMVCNVWPVISGCLDGLIGRRRGDFEARFALMKAGSEVLPQVGHGLVRLAVEVE